MAAALSCSSRLATTLHANSSFLRQHFKDSSKVSCAVDSNGNLSLGTRRGLPQVTLNYEKTGLIAEMHDPLSDTALQIITFSCFLACEHLPSRIPSCSFASLTKIPDSFDLCQRLITTYQKCFLPSLDHMKQQHHSSTERMPEEQHFSFTYEIGDLIERHEQIDQLRAKIEDLQKRVSSPETCIQPQEDPLRQGELNLQQLRALDERLRADIKKSTDEIEALKKQKQMIDPTKGNKSEKKTRIRKLQQEIESKNTHKDTLNREHAQVERDISAAELRIGMLRQAPRQIEAKREADASRIAELERELSALQEDTLRCKDLFNKTYTGEICNCAAVTPETPVTLAAGSALEIDMTNSQAAPIVLRVDTTNPAAPVMTLVNAPGIFHKV